MKRMKLEKRDKLIEMRKNTNVITKEQALVLLDEIDSLRREIDNFSTADFQLRLAAAVIAGYAGYSSRADWTHDLKADENTLYSMDYNDFDYWSKF